MRYTKQEIEKAKEDLREYDWKNDSLIAIIRKVSRSGMTRHIDFYSKNHLHMLSGDIAKALDWRYSDDGVVVGGCGMDMVFHTVYCLTHALYGHDEQVIEKMGLKGNGGDSIEWRVL